MMNHTTIKHGAAHILKRKNPGCNIILIARKSKKMFQNMKMCITENKTNKNLSLKNVFDFPDFQVGCEPC